MGAAQAQHAASMLPQVLTRSGFTPTPQAYFETLPRKVSGLVQYVAIGLILEHTFGARRAKNTAPPEWAAIPNRTFAKHTGASDRAVEMVLEDGAKRGLIARRPGPDKRGYEYKALVEGWASAPEHSPRAVPKKPVSVSDETHTAEAEFEGAPETKAALKVVPKNEPLLVLPGKPSRPIPLSDVTTKVVCRNHTGAEIRIAALTDAEFLYLNIQDSPNSSSGKKGAAAKGNTRTPVRETSSEPNPVLAHYQRDPRFDELQEKLEPWFDSLYGKALDEPMICRILGKLGTAKVDDYLRLCEQNLQRKRSAGSGLFINWAGDAAFAASRRVERSKVEQRRFEENERAERIRALVMCLRWAGNPDAKDREEREIQQFHPNYVPQDWREYVCTELENANPEELAEAKRIFDSGDFDGH